MPLQLFLQPSNLPQRLEKQIVGQPQVHGAAEQIHRFFKPLGLDEPARQPDQVRAVPQRCARRRPERERDHCRQTSQRDDIHHVVMKDRHELEGLLRAQVLKIIIRNHFAGQVTLALEAEDLVLQVHQPAAIQPQFPQAARTMQQVQMSQPRKRRPRARHAVARFQQWHIVCLAVISDQHIEAGQVLRQPRQQ